MKNDGLRLFFRIVLYGQGKVWTISPQRSDGNCSQLRLICLLRPIIR